MNRTDVMVAMRHAMSGVAVRATLLFTWIAE